jgi:hypothetical protein
VRAYLFTGDTVLAAARSSSCCGCPAVTIAGRKLYISNGNISCGKETCSSVEQALPLVRRVTQSLAVGA